MYLPQYKLGKYELLPYNSTSLDAPKNSADIEDFKKETILISYSDQRDIEKTREVLSITDLPHRNRLISDLLSFIHIMKCRAHMDDSAFKELQEILQALDPQISEQIFSQEDLKDYKNIFSSAVKAIASSDFVIPAHLIPYTWADEDWTDTRIDICVEMITSLLMIVNRIYGNL